MKRDRASFCSSSRPVRKAPASTRSRNHLNVLKDAGIIHCRPEGTSHYYYISIKQHLPHLYKLNHDVGAFLREYYKDDEAELEKFDKMGIPLK